MGKGKDFLFQNYADFNPKKTLANNKNGFKPKGPIVNFIKTV